MNRQIFIVLASRWDSAALRFVERHAAAGACLLTPAELSQAGWRYRPGYGAEGRAVIAGRSIAVTAMAGVVVRLPYVGEQDLPHIVPSDRAYVAAELNAFLLAWLTELPCPVLNRPSPSCLAGPGWRQEQWLQQARRLGIPSVPLRRSVRLPAVCPASDPPPAGVMVTIVGDRCFGAVNPVVAEHARALARAAGVGLLAVAFSRSAENVFMGADYWPDISLPAVADAIVDYLRARTAA